MWTFIVNTFKSLFDSLFYVLREAWRQAGLLLGNFWVWLAALGSIVGTIIDRFEGAIAAIVGYADYFAAIVWPDINPGSLSYYFRLANTLLPMNEGITMLFILCVIIVIGTSYRFVKSWIPTLS